VQGDDTIARMAACSKEIPCWPTSLVHGYGNRGTPARIRASLCGARHSD